MNRLRRLGELMPIEFKEFVKLEKELRKLRSEESELALRQKELANMLDPKF